MAPISTNVQTLDLSVLAQTSASSKVIQPGDVLDVTISTGLHDEDPIESKLQVGASGAVDVPLVGPVRLAGYEIENAHQIIRDECVRRQIFQNPNVSVLVHEQNANRVTVLGEVKEPNEYQLPVASSDLLSALVAAQGLTEKAGTIVEIRQPGLPGHDQAPGSLPPGTRRIDLREATASGARGDYRLGDGAVVMVMKKPPRTVYVRGLVKKPDEYPMPEDRDLRLLEALTIAGDRTIQIADKVKIIRKLPNLSQPVTIAASIRDAKSAPASNIRLAPGDVIEVEETPTTFVVQTLKDFVRFGVSGAVPLF